MFGRLRHPRTGLVDIHVHILPGLDDGPVGWAASVEMARQAVQAGTVAVVATPHVLPGRQDGASLEFIGQMVDDLRSRLKAANVPLHVVPGGEVYPTPDLGARLAAREVPLMGQAGQVRYILVDTPLDVLPPRFEELLFEIRLAGVTPVLAHPERCRALQTNPERAASLAAQGSLFQVTAGSLLGEFGQQAQRAGWHYLESGVAHVVASDSHGTERRSPASLARAYKVVARQFGEEWAMRLFSEHPGRMVRGEPIPSTGVLERAGPWGRGKRRIIPPHGGARGGGQLLWTEAGREDGGGRLPVHPGRLH